MDLVVKRKIAALAGNRNLLVQPVRSLFAILITYFFIYVELF